MYAGWPPAPAPAWLRYTGETMRDSLAALKRHQPRRRFRDVLRPRLIRALDELVAGSDGAVVVGAPDGHGKTTALASWAARLEQPVAWWTFGPEDDDPALTLRALARALDGVCPGAGVAVRDALHLDAPPPVPALVAQLCAELQACEEPCILVLDDVHQLRDGDARAVVERLARTHRGALRLVLGGDLEVSGWAPAGTPRLEPGVLRFDEAETHEFLDQTADLELAQEHAETLIAHAGGCVSTLQLATQALARSRTPARVLEEIASGTGVAPLIDRLLRALPRPVREFLLRTAVLERHCAPLCDAVTGGDDGAEMIQRLDRLNLFTESLDAGYTWFRTHPWLRTRLLPHLEALPDARVPALHQRAAGWHAGRELPLQAARHARAAEEPGALATAVERLTPWLLQHGAWRSLRRWLDEVPADRAAAHPGLRAARAWGHWRVGALDRAEAAMEEILQSQDRDDTSTAALDLQGQGCVIQARAALEQGDPRIAVELAERAAALLAEDNLWVRRRIPALLGDALCVEGDLAGAEQGYLEVERVGRYLDDLWFTVHGLCRQGELRVIQGELRGADVLYDNAVAFVERYRARRFEPAAAIDLGIAELRWHRNHLADASARVDAALQILDGERPTEPLLRAWALRARILRSQRRLDEADAAVAAGEALAGRGGPPWSRALLACERAQLWLSRGELDAAERWAARRDGRAGEATLVREQVGLVVARLLLAQEQYDDALVRLARMEQDAAAGRRRGRVIEIRVLQAIGRFGQGRHEKALSRLGRALRRAMRERMVQLFLDEGEAMIAVLRHGVERNIWVRPEIQPFAQALLAACESTAAGVGGEP